MEWAKNDDNEADSPRNKPILGYIGADRSNELKITEEENDLENWKRKKTETQIKPFNAMKQLSLSNIANVWN